MVLFRNIVAARTKSHGTSWDRGVCVLALLEVDWSWWGRKVSGDDFCEGVRSGDGEGGIKGCAGGFVWCKHEG